MIFIPNLHSVCTIGTLEVGVCNSKSVLGMDIYFPFLPPGGKGKWPGEKRKGKEKEKKGGSGKKKVGKEKKKGGESNFLLKCFKGYIL